MHSMEQYVASIKSRGSADGFNTEFPEQLHIDFAKNAYRATNKKDYVGQMTKWLARQEAVDQFVAYLDWRLQRGLGVDEVEVDGDVDDVEGGVLNVDVTEVAQPSAGRSAGSPGQFDTVLVQSEGNTNVHTRGTALEGFQVAQVRLIFDLPMHLRTPGQPFHLALIEWFNPFRARDTMLQLHTVSHSHFWISSKGIHRTSSRLGLRDAMLVGAAIACYSESIVVMCKYGTSTTYLELFEKLDDV
ncbi:hypothetical protein BDR07DRAFT_1383378 [Suillus spraguei]|nr:hypothetical protein BDR07DRAFT_1383378 [Suillus spraguei]